LKIAEFHKPNLVWGPRSGEPLRICGWNLASENYSLGATR